MPIQEEILTIVAYSSEAEVFVQNVAQEMAATGTETPVLVQDAGLLGIIACDSTQDASAYHTD